MRTILTDTTECGRKCPGCYYTRRIGDDTVVRDLHTVLDEVEEVAIGWNYGQSTNALLMDAIERRKDIVLTISADTIVPSMAFKGVGVVSVSVGPGRWEVSPTILQALDNSDATRVLSVVQESWIDPDLHSITDSMIGMDVLYYLKGKGAPDQGWRMTEEEIDNYLEDLCKVGEIAEVRADECVMGILDHGYGNCDGIWQEIDSYGGVRSCPYTAKPDYRITECDAYAGTYCKCRIGEE